MNRSHRQAGFVLQESIMAMALSMALIVGVAELLTMVAQQRRLARQQAVAVQEVGNLMEELVSRRWDDTTAVGVASAELSPQCNRCLPNAELALDVVDESDDIRQITVQIDWSDASGGRGRSVRLVGWKFREKEGH